MSKQEDDSPKDVIKPGKKDEEASPDKEREEKKDREDRGYPTAPPAYPAQSNYYPPPPPAKPMFTPEGMPKILAIGILIGIILLFVGSMIFVAASYMDPSEEEDAEDRDDAYDLQRNLYTSSRLVGAIGLFLTGIFTVLPLMLIKDLSTTQRIMLIGIIAAIIIGFTLIIQL